MAINRLLLASAVALLPASLAFSQGAGMTERWSATNVTPDKPFGDIAMSGPMATPDDAMRFLEGLSGKEVVEIIGRCGVIAPGDFTVASTDPTTAGGQAGGMPAGADAATTTAFPAEASTFCRNISVALLTKGNGTSVQ